MRSTNLTTVDLNLLIALEVLLEELHVSKAAERLNMSQPNMSRTLGRLREVFEDPLIFRVGGSYVKTSRAESLEVEIKPALEALRRTLGNPDFHPESSNSVFRIFASDYGEVVLLPTLVKLFHEEAPNAQLEVGRLTRSLSEEVQDGPHDLILGNLVPKGFPKECEFERLFDDHFMCVMRRDHPFAEGELTLERYLACSHSTISTARGLMNWVDLHLNSLGHTRKITKQSPYVLASLFSLRHTDMLQSSPMRLVQPLLEPLNLIAKELPFEMEISTYCQIWHTRNTSNPAHRWFRSLVTRAAGKIGGCSAARQ